MFEEERVASRMMKDAFSRRYRRGMPLSARLDRTHFDMLDGEYVAKHQIRALLEQNIQRFEADLGAFKIDVGC